MRERNTGGDATDSGTAVAPTKADITAIEAAGESEADRKGIDEQLVDEVTSTARFAITLGVFAVLFLLVGAGLFWLVTDVAGIGLTETGEYGVLVLTLFLAIYVTISIRNLGRLLWTLYRH